MYTEDEIELVIARLRAIPKNALLSIGNINNNSGFDRDELIEHVKKMDEIGKKIIQMQLNYVRSYK
jgi:hypothetical protein